MAPKSRFWVLTAVGLWPHWKSKVSSLLKSNLKMQWSYKPPHVFCWFMTASRFKTSWSINCLPNVLCHGYAFCKLFIIRTHEVFWQVFREWNYDQCTTFSRTCICSLCKFPLSVEVLSIRHALERCGRAETPSPVSRTIFCPRVTLYIKGEVKEGVFRLEKSTRRYKLLVKRIQLSTSFYF